MPPFNEDWEADPAPPTIARLRDLIAGSDGLLIATPEYNGSIPGQLKNAVDWASRPYGAGALQDKPTAVISASPLPSGAAGAAADLRRVLTRAKASVLGSGLAVPGASAQFRQDGRLADPDLDRQLCMVTSDLIQATGKRRTAA